MGAHGAHRILRFPIATHGRPCVPMDAHGCPWVLMDAQVLMGAEVSMVPFRECLISLGNDANLPVLVSLKNLEMEHVMNI